MWKAIKKWWSSSKSDSTIINKYFEAGTDFGDAVSYIYMGECIGFEKLFDAWEDLEKEVAKRGYQTISVDDFVAAGGYGKDLPGLRKLKKSEEAILHAKYYRENYLGKMFMSDSLMDTFTNGVVSTGTYEIPTTKHLEIDK